MSMFSTGLNDDIPQWTTVAPTESGHYWVMMRPSPYFIGVLGPHHVRVINDPAGEWVFVYVAACGGYTPMSDITHWMRINVPGAPT